MSADLEASLQQLIEEAGVLLAVLMLFTTYH